MQNEEDLEEELQARNGHWSDRPEYDENGEPNE